jgi:hypothetical protein
MIDMDATTVITLAIPATRKLNITAAPRQPQELDNKKVVTKPVYGLEIKEC